MKTKVLIIFGTRPEIIKLAPVYHKLKDHCLVSMLHTGQHVELAEDVLDFFSLRPTIHGNCMSDSYSYQERLHCLMDVISHSIESENPDIVIVQGDTLTTYTGAFIAFILKKPVLHLEAGLRTCSKYSPYPEEIYRNLVSRIADFHFAPTLRSCDNLIREGIREDRILLAGNTIVDTVHMVPSLLDRGKVFQELAPYQIDMNKIADKNFVLITSHRRENIGAPLRQICTAVETLSQRYNNLLFIWILHKNPEVREIVIEMLSKKKENIALIEALTYPAMIYLLKDALMTMTDSGGIQEEAAALNKPIMILREVTERQEIVECGLGKLIGVDEEKIIQSFCSFMDGEKETERHLVACNPFGDGLTCDRLLDFLMLDEIRSFLGEYPQSADRTLKFKDKIKAVSCRS